MGTNVAESVRVQGGPEQSYKGLWGTSVPSLGHTEAVYHTGSVSFWSSGSSLPSPHGLSGHQLLMEMNGMSTLSLSLVSTSLSLDVCSELAPSAGSGPKASIRSELFPSRKQVE